MRRVAVACVLSSTIAAWTLAGFACGGSAFQSGAGDGGPSGDTGSMGDVSPSTDAGSSYCKTSTALFCEDFDEYPSGQAGVSALLGSTKWTTFQQSMGSFSFDTVNPPSPPNALEATGGSGAQVAIAKGFLGSDALTKLRLEFDLRINNAGSIGDLSAAGFAAISFGSSIDDGFAAIAMGAGPVLAAAWTLAPDAGVPLLQSFKTQPVNGTFPTIGKWSGRYAVEVDYSTPSGAKTGCVQVFQGLTPLLTPCLALPVQLLHPKELAIAIGDYAAGGASTGSIDIEFDNVTFNMN